MNAWSSHMRSSTSIRKRNMKTLTKLEPRLISWQTRSLVSVRKSLMILLFSRCTPMMSSISQSLISLVSQESLYKTQINQQMLRKSPRIWLIRKWQKRWIFWKFAEFIIDTNYKIRYIRDERTIILCVIPGN